MSEMARAAEGFGIRAEYPIGESLKEHGILVVRKYDPDAVAWASKKMGGGKPGALDFIGSHEHDFHRLKIDPYEVVESVSNMFVTAGWQRLMNLLIGAGGTTYASATCRIGVGTATAAAANTQTDLQAATGSANREWQMVTGNGSTGTGTGAGNSRLSFVATFGSGNANFAWQEWGIDQGTASSNAASTAPLLNRAVSSLGTKASPAIWTATSQLDFG